MKGLTLNQRLSLAGISTIRRKEKDSKGRTYDAIYLECKGKMLGRPPVNKIESWCLANFNVLI